MADGGNESHGLNQRMGKAVYHVEEIIFKSNSFDVSYFLF